MLDRNLYAIFQTCRKNVGLSSNWPHVFLESLFLLTGYELGGLHREDLKKRVKGNRCSQAWRSFGRNKHSVNSKGQSSGLSSLSCTGSLLPLLPSRTSGCRRKLSNTPGGEWRWQRASDGWAGRAGPADAWSLGMLGGPAQLGCSAGVSHPAFSLQLWGPCILRPPPLPQYLSVHQSFLCLRVLPWAQTPAVPSALRALCPAPPWRPVLVPTTSLSAGAALQNVGFLWETCLLLRQAWVSFSSLPPFPVSRASVLNPQGGEGYIKIFR